jgi:hypothetical protein
MTGKVDVEATVEGGGPSGQAGAVRYGIAMGLRCFVDSDTIERMRLGKLRISFLNPIFIFDFKCQIVKFILHLFLYSWSVD